jgi:hypothetical protein
MLCENYAPGRTTCTRTCGEEYDRPMAEAADARTVRAWRLYEESTQGLSGEEYVQAEARAWDRLQRMLDEIRLGRSRRRVDVHV